MIPQGIRLYTWADVEKVFMYIRDKHEWPEWLVAAQAYWDDLTLTIRPETPDDEVTAWLEKNFDPRLGTREDGQNVIILESSQEEQRELPIFLEDSEEDSINPRLVPSFTKPSFVLPPFETQHPQHPAPFPSDFPPLIAFHSFKGGVGRTTHAIALALALTETQNNNVVTESNVGTEPAEVRVLLVDADLEAPGISFLFEDESLPVSYTDLLTLVHGDPDSSAEKSIALVADRLQSTLMDGIYVLPAFRSVNSFGLIDIRPEHLFQRENPFVITTILAKLGKALNVQAVIIDLRAGISELSAGTLLDPRVYRVLVTTPSSQSVAGTKQMIDLLTKLAPEKEDYEPPLALIISQVTRDQRDLGILESLKNELTEELMKLAPVEDSETMPNVNIPGYKIIFTSFNPELMVLPNDWAKVKAILAEQGMIRAISKQLPDWLPDLQKVISGANPEEVSSPPEVDLEAQRKQIAEFAKSLLYAESGFGSDSLVTSPLRNLANSFANKVPIAVVVGAKGSGKTFSFLQLMRLQTWQKFAKYMGNSAVSFDAPVYAVLQSKNLKDKALEEVKEANEKTLKILGFTDATSNERLSSLIKEFLRKKDLHEGSWLDYWLDCIAWKAGFESEKRGAGRRFVEALREKDQRVIAVIDGLEDLFQDLPTNRNQQIALRSLLQEVPHWLGQQPSPQIGLIVFVRQDMVRHAIRQNIGQFLALYDSYALQWDEVEALRLVAWIANQTGILQITEIAAMNWDYLTKKLIPLWGSTLGTKKTSKEPPSTNWVIKALSDLKGQIQARDLVRFLYEAAQGSLGEDLKDRLLAPKAIKKAIGPCSKEKIAEIKVENPKLSEILAKLANLTKPLRKVPFELAKVSLTLAEITILEENGVVLRVGERYDMPEIFRLGLGFIRAGRPPVISLSNQARKRSS